MSRFEQSRSTVNGRADRVVRLDSAVQELVGGRISPQQDIFASIDKLWSQLLPSGLIQHCKIDDVSGGQLKVKVDSPLYVHELRLICSELLKELQKQCPKARIKKIKFTLA